MRTGHVVRLAGVALTGALALSACDFGELRPFNSQKGVYLGKPHEPLDQGTLIALRARGSLQSDDGATVVGGTAQGSSAASASSGTSRQRTVPGGAAGGEARSSNPVTTLPSATTLRQRAAYQRDF